MPHTANSDPARGNGCMQRKTRTMRLGHFARELASTSSEDDKSIDYTAASLYLPAAQTIFATTLSSAVSVLACWLVPVGAISAVRTFALTTASGVVVIHRPVKVGHTKGINTIFAALRPCCLIYVACLVLEQLVHTCVSEDVTYEHGYARRIIYHFSMTLLTVAAFMRARSPRSESDLPFLVSVCAVLIIALLPPPALSLSGPLCSPPTLAAAAERVVRAFMFACVYVTLVYSAAPISNNLGDTIVCIARSAAASSWVLGAIVYSVPLAVLQTAIVVYCAFSATSLQYNSVSARLEIESTDARQEQMKGHINGGFSSTESDDDSIRSANQAAQLSTQVLNASSLNFDLSNLAQQHKNSIPRDPKKTMAQVADSIP